MAYAGDDIDIADFAALQSYYKIKPAGENSTTATMQNDDDLVAALGVGIWEVILRASVTGNASGDIQQTWTTTGTMTGLTRQVLGPSSGMTSALGNSLPRMQGNLALSDTPVFGVDGTNASFVQEFLIVDVDVPGNLQWRWCNSGATGTTSVLAGSYMTYRLLTAG